jgi:hypothetical protein
MEGGGVPPGCEDFFTEEGWAMMSEEGKQAVLEIVYEAAHSGE